MEKNTIKKCVICGAEFTPRNANAKYCGALCREQGRKEYRKQWELENDYKESQRLRMKEARSREADELNTARQRITAAEQKRRTEAHRQRAEQREKKLKARADQGDTFAALILEQQTNGNTNPEYWELFKQYETEQGHLDTKINGIPLTHPQFALAVAISIEEGNAIIKSI